MTPPRLVPSSCGCLPETRDLKLEAELFSPKFDRGINIGIPLGYESSGKSAIIVRVQPETLIQTTAPRFTGFGCSSPYFGTPLACSVSNTGS